MMHIFRKPKAVIVDMDGTLCDIRAIRFLVATPGAKDFDTFHRAARSCPPNRQALDFCRRHYASGRVIVVVTARMERHYASSRAWLDEHLPVPFDGPIMRPEGMRHSDVAVKSRILRYLVRNYDIRAACDDNPSIIALWREHGIPVEVVPGWQDHAGDGSRPAPPRPRKERP